MKIIGVTGGIGSGKTTISEIIMENGYPVYNSDKRAKEIVNTEPEIRNKIINLLGPFSYDKNGSYNRKWVGQQIFSNPNLLSNLNEIIHPVVERDFINWSKNFPQRNFVFRETALLFELRLEKDCHKSILVTSNKALRIKRVIQRDGKTTEEIKKIMKLQMPETEKIKKAHFIIYNNSDLNYLKKKTEEILSLL